MPDAGSPDAGSCKTCDALQVSCGLADDGCGHQLSCGACTPSAFCGPLPAGGRGCQLYEAKVAIFDRSLVAHSTWGVGGGSVYFGSAFSTVYRYLNGTVTKTAIPQISDINGIWAQTENLVYAVGPGGGMFKSDGTSWTQINSKTAVDLNSVWGAPDGSVWAVGNSARVVTLDKGIVSVITFAGVTANLNSVWGSSSRDVWVAGDASFIAHFNGTDWRVRTAPISSSFSTVFGSGPLDAWVAGPNNVALHYAGSSFVQTTVPAATISDVLYGGWAASPTDAWLVGKRGSLKGVIFHWDGSAWSKYADVDVPMFSAWGSGPSDVWFAGLGLAAHYGP